ncbi:MAG: hydantoinase/oxoprolinase family protein [Devosia sp.]|nr:hydantoinase/oxoprolinase family protein [Devosia sp.]
MTGGPRLSVDIGGTFTDLVLLGADGSILSLKVSSTPAAPEDAVLAGLTQLLAMAGVPPSALTEVLHGTTVGSNTLLQKGGARTGLLTTRGFRDVLEIGRLRTPGMFDLNWDKPAPLVPRRYRLEVDERMSAQGDVLRPVNAEDIRAAGRVFRNEGIESVAICFLNSYRNPANERQAARIVAAEFPEIALTASIDVLPEAGEYERTSTTVVNAYVLPPFRGYLRRLEDKLRASGVTAPLLVGNSNGGLSSSIVAQARPVFFISSGRASGAAGASRLGAATDERDLVVFDMGGTTASAALIHDRVLGRTNEYEFRAGMSVPSRFIKAGGYMMRVPTVDVAEVGNGAGSIAAIDAGGLLTVGPVSAGALPGPVCYGLGGTQPTVTDANVVLGFLPPLLAGGTVKLHVDAARRAIEHKLAGPLNLSIEAAALGIRDIANANMMRAIRAVTIERGLDPRDLTLFAFGGSGPVHACDLARTLGIARVLFPPGPGVFTATGMLAGTVEHHELRTLALPLGSLTAQILRSTQAEMREVARVALAAQGYGGGAASWQFEIDLRLEGQESCLQVAVGDDPDEPAIAALRPAFLALYRDTYGYSPDDAIEAVSLRLHAHGDSRGSLDFLSLRPEAQDAGMRAATRLVFFDRTGWRETPILRRGDLAGEMAGPVIIESADTTIVIPPAATVAPAVAGSIMATLHGGSR